MGSPQRVFANSTIAVNITFKLALVRQLWKIFMQKP